MVSLKNAQGSPGRMPPEDRGCPIPRFTQKLFRSSSGSNLAQTMPVLGSMENASSNDEQLIQMISLERADAEPLCSNGYSHQQTAADQCLSALLSARGTLVEHLNAVYCALFFMGHEPRKSVAFQYPFVGGCAGP